ncbi:MAG: flagellar biosynthesis protein FlhF [Candidatus Omnitrophica bacterium]|nr:flagellar biosynthesis protein FlhF [Candidatus Omnitrophota bacterium]
MKKFQAKDMAEAMRMVKAELGPNAIILYSRDVGGGLFGWFRKKTVEVTAALDPKVPAASAPVAAPPERPVASASPTPLPRIGQKVDFRISDEPLAPSREENPLLALSKKLEREKKTEKEMPPRESLPPLPPAVPRKDGPVPGPVNLEDRLSTMENRLIKLTKLLENLAPSLTVGEIPAVPPRTRELYTHLLDQDVDERLALVIANQIAETTDEKDDVWTALKSYLTSKIETAPPAELDFHARQPKVIMLVGPTGVGKTTTLAKISAQYRYNPLNGIRPKIVFITADLYRLAAVEQLQKYTEILGVELEVTYSPDEVRQALAKHKDAHLVLFDTAGTCQRNMPQMSTLAGIVEASHPSEVHLVISSTTKYSDMVDVVEHFKEVHPTRLIFTKIDESTTYGPLLNTVMKFKIPISYLTTGQNVPEDIERARPERIAKLLLSRPTVNRAVLEEPPAGVLEPPAVPLTDRSGPNGSAEPVCAQDQAHETQNS